MMEHSPSALERVPGRVVPMFPLPNVWLFPAVILPLHVFEQRYRQMVEDCLDGPGRIVLGTIRAGHEPDASGAPDAPGTPPIYPVAGLGEIGRHERLPDGRFNLLLVGLQRVVVREAPSDRLYRKVEIQPAPEQPIPAAREPALREALLASLAELATELPEATEPYTTGHLADLLVLRLSPGHETVQRLYGELDVEQRARAALAEHRRRRQASS
jgi:Lon protease-like protein